MVSKFSLAPHTQFTNVCQQFVKLLLLSKKKKKKTLLFTSMIIVEGIEKNQLCSVMARAIPVLRFTHVHSGVNKQRGWYKGHRCNLGLPSGIAIAVR